MSNLNPILKLLLAPFPCFFPPRLVCVGTAGAGKRKGDRHKASGGLFRRHDPVGGWPAWSPGVFPARLFRLSSAPVVRSLDHVAAIDKHGLRRRPTSDPDALSHTGPNRLDSRRVTGSLPLSDGAVRRECYGLGCDVKDGGMPILIDLGCLEALELGGCRRLGWPHRWVLRCLLLSISGCCDRAATTGQCVMVDGMMRDDGLLLVCLQRGQCLLAALLEQHTLRCCLEQSVGLVVGWLPTAHSHSTSTRACRLNWPEAGNRQSRCTPSDSEPQSPNSVRAMSIHVLLTWCS